MANITDVLEQFIRMGARFEALEQQVLRIEERQIVLLDRLSRLEERLNAVNESARSAARASVIELKSQMIERITRLEIELEQSRKLLGPTDLQAQRPPKEKG